LIIVGGNNAASHGSIFLWRFFLVAMELLQVTPGAEGKFDLCYIAVGFQTEAVAVLFIKN